MSKVAERFLKYVSFDTQSKDEEEQVPSTEKQLVLAKELVKELEEMGASDVRLSEHGYVYATIEANTEKNCPLPGLCSPYGYGTRHVRPGCESQNCGEICRRRYCSE